jgi:hypothetical protein
MFAHHEPVRDFAAKAANYFKKTAGKRIPQRGTNENRTTLFVCICVHSWLPPQSTQWGRNQRLRTVIS